MWCITNYKSRKIQLDFTDSGMGYREVTQILSNDIVVANAYELMDFDNDRVQFILCESCGIEHCEPGGWLHIRKADHFVIFHPAFHLMSEGNFEKEEYSPPKYVKKQGIPYMHFDLYNQIRADFPDINTIPKLTRSDALCILQHDAPYRLLGDIYSGENNKLDSIIAASKGESIDYVNLLRMLYLEDLSSDAEAVIKPVDPKDEIITLFYEINRIMEWELFVVNMTTGLLLSKDFYMCLDDVMGTEHDNN